MMDIYEVTVKCYYCSFEGSVMKNAEDYQEYVELMEDDIKFCCGECEGKSRDKFRKEFKEEKEKEDE